MKLNEKIKFYRKRILMTQSELASKSDISLRALSNYESGLRTPSLEIKIKLAKALNIQVTDLDSNIPIWEELNDSEISIVENRSVKRAMNNSAEASIKIYENSDIYRLRIDISDVAEPNMKSEDLLSKIVDKNSVLISNVVYVKFYDILANTSYLINLDRINKFELTDVIGIE